MAGPTARPGRRYRWPMGVRAARGSSHTLLPLYLPPLLLLASQNSTSTTSTAQLEPTRGIVHARSGAVVAQQSAPVPNWTEAESESVEGLSGLGMPPLVRGSDDVAYSAIRGWSGSGRSLGRRAEPGCGLLTIPLYPSTNHPQLGRTALIPAARVTGRHFPTVQVARWLTQSLDY